MGDSIIDGNSEKKILKDMLGSKEAALIAAFGRRRVGKTFLVRNYYHQQLVFECTGIHDASLGDQLLNFSRALQQSVKSPIPPATPQYLDTSFHLPKDLLYLHVFQNISY